MGLEPTISCLEGKRSTTELRPRALYSTVTVTDGQPVQGVYNTFDGLHPMKTKRVILLLHFLALFLLQTLHATASGPVVQVLTIDGAITPAT
jgi:hypothetical protein